MSNVKVDFRDAKKQIQKYKKVAAREVAKTLEVEIVTSISRGISPVKGEGRFNKYSDSYTKQIKAGTYGESKRIRPVNLKLTGDLLRSLIVKATKKGISVIFDNKLADIHNRVGAGKSKAIRRMLPTQRGEEFSRSITMRLREVLNRVAISIFKG